MPSAALDRDHIPYDITQTIGLFRCMLLPKIGRAGLAAFVCMLVSVIPMAVGALRRRFSFELRKLLHYVSVVMIVSIDFLSLCHVTHACCDAMSCPEEFDRNQSSLMCSCSLSGSLI